MIEINNIQDCIQYLDAIDVVLFDLDDTLTNEIDYVKSGYRAVAKEFPQIQNCEEKLLKAFKNKLPAIDAVLESEELYSEENKAKALHAYRFQKPEIEFISGAKETLVQLRRQNKKLGIITDGRPEGQQAKIDALELENLVDKIIITDALGGTEFRKPNPKAYELMQEFFSVQFQKMAYIGDNIKKDFIAPEKLGMKIVYFINECGIY